MKLVAPSTSWGGGGFICTQGLSSLGAGSAPVSSTAGSRQITSW